MDEYEHVLDQPTIHNLYTAIGYVAHTWCYTEQNTDMACSVIFHQCDGNARIQDQIPKFTKEKNKFLDRKSVV